MPMYESRPPKDYDHQDDNSIHPDSLSDQPLEEAYSGVDQPAEEVEMLQDYPEAGPAAGTHYLLGPEDAPRVDAAEQCSEITDEVELAHESPVVPSSEAKDTGLPLHLVELLASAGIDPSMTSEELRRMAEDMVMGMVRHRETLPEGWPPELIDVALEQHRKLLHAVQRAAMQAREAEDQKVAGDVAKPHPQEEAVVAEMDVPGEHEEGEAEPGDDGTVSGPETEATNGGEAPPSPPAGPNALGEPGDDPWFWVQVDSRLGEADRVIWAELMPDGDITREHTGPTGYLAIQKDIHDTPEGEDYPARVARSIAEVVNVLRGHGVEVLGHMPQLFVERLGTQLLAVGDTLEAQMRAIQTLPPQSIGPEERASARERLDRLVEHWSEPLELYLGNGDVHPGQSYSTVDDNSLAASAEARETFPQRTLPSLSSADLSSAGVSNPAFARIGVFNAALDDMAYRISREAVTLIMLRSAVLEGAHVIEESGKGSLDMLNALDELVMQFEVLEDSVDRRMRMASRFYDRRMPLFRA